MPVPNPVLLLVPYRFSTGINSGSIFSQLPVNGTGDFTYTRPGSASFVGSNGNIQFATSHNARILNYYSGSGTCPAFLIEPSATNGIRNNSMVGASAPNTLPNNWSNAGSNLTRQSVATGTLNGIPYVDIRISGTANNTYHDVFWDASTVIAALVGQDWVASCYLQIIAQPNPPVSYTLAMREFNSSSGFLGVFQGAALSISTTSFNRFSFTRALNQAAVAFVHPSLFFTLFNGQFYDFTIRIGYPQMERGTVPTSVIHTTTAAVTRNADIATDASYTFPLPNGTIYTEHFASRTSSYYAHSVGPVPITTGSNRIAVTYTPSKIAVYKNGSFLMSQSMGTYEVGGSIIDLGHSSGSYQLNDNLLAFAVYDSELTPADAISLTSGSL